MMANGFTAAAWLCRIVLAMLAGLVALAASPASAQPCDPCSIAAGQYRATAPPGWNGRDPLGLLLFLHGWQATGSNMVDDPAVAGPAARLGFLLVAPDGIGKSWGHVGSPSQQRDDVAFLRDVAADAKRRWPIDPARVVAAGFSQGGSMVWDLACFAAADFTAFLPFSGGFWEPMATSCSTGPVNLRHVHGRDDRTVPMAGRRLNGRFAQADIRRGFAVWLAEDRCPQAPDRKLSEPPLECDDWSSCATGRRLQLCLRDGDHYLDPATLEGGLRWAAGLPVR